MAARLFRFRHVFCVCLGAQPRHTIVVLFLRAAWFGCLMKSLLCESLRFFHTACFNYRGWFSRMGRAFAVGQALPDSDKFDIEQKRYFSPKTTFSAKFLLKISVSCTKRKSNKRPVLQSLRNVRTFNVFGVVKVGNGSCELDNSVVSAS